MRLFKVPNGSYVKLLALKEDNVLYFDRLDGQYSICYTKEGNLVHPHGTTEVEVVTQPTDWNI